jgi:hypothetical protein
VRAAAALILLAVALAGCGGGGSGSSDVSPDELIQEAAAKTGAQKSFHFVLAVEHPAPSSSGLSLTSADGDIVVPDKVKADVAGSFNGIPLTSKIVFTGAKQFLQNPLSGGWQSFETKTSPIAFFSPAKGVLSVIEGTTDLKVTGSESCAGGDCWRVEGKVPASKVTPILGNPPSDRKADVVLLVGKDDKLLRRVRLEGPLADNEPDDIVRTVDISRYGEQVTIEAPAAG